MSKNLKFQDSIVIEQSIPGSAKSDASEMLNRDRSPKLRVEIDATHSGVLTNMRVYPGKFVKDGYKSFISKARGGTADYDKPILKHHDDHADAIGRVIDSRYTPIKYGEQFDFDYLSPDPVGGKGSGVVTITGIINDPDSIKKIIDSRFISVSVRHHSSAYLCSVCGEDIMGCEHIPGAKYESDSSEKEISCYVITGPLGYDEVSFVNIPAQPPAKLVNFAWTDSKDNWADNLITSQIMGKKETVRTFSLCDEDGELSLISGKKNLASKKTVVAVSPATADKLKHALSPEEPGTDDEIAHVRQPDDGKTSVVSDVEQNLDKAKKLDDQKSKEEAKMDNSKELAELQTKLKGLEDQLSVATTKVKDLETQVAAKDSQITRLTSDASAMQTKMARSLAYSLATIRIRLNKPGSEELDSKEKFDGYVTQLAARSIESLQDSIVDLLPELNKEPETKGNTKSVTDMVADKKVESTVPSKAKDGKPGDKAGNKKTNGSDKAVDRFDQILGIK